MNYGAMTVANRLKRVQFVYGLDEAGARIFIKGWVKGRRAALEDYRRGVQRQSRAKVGSLAWERQARPQRKAT